MAPLAQADRQSFMTMLERLVEINNDYSRAPMRTPRGASRPDRGVGKGSRSASVRSRAADPGQ
jgi:hypothetical protein